MAGPMPDGIKPKNKLRRQSAYQKLKQTQEAAKRDLRFKRKREEAKNPALRAERLARNRPVTIDDKRVYDDENLDDEGDALGWAIDVERQAKKRRLDQEAEETGEGEDGEDGLLAKLKKRDEEEEEAEEEEDEVDSMLNSDSEAGELDSDEEEDIQSTKPKKGPNATERASSPASTAAKPEISSDYLKQKFSAVYNASPNPKTLVTTSINSTLHHEAEILCGLFPNSNYVRRNSHAHSHKYSVKEIAAFAANRSYTHLVVLNESMLGKKPEEINIIVLPEGPSFHLSIKTWVEGKKLPGGHGNDQGFHPELVLSGFKTPLGLLTAQLFQSIFPAQPEFVGRTAVTLHNHRDFIFLRRHRYIFRDKRKTEKEATGTDGNPVKGVEGIRVGMQELGPRATLKLRRIDKGIQFKSGQEWEWKAGMEKQRTRFNM